MRPDLFSFQNVERIIIAAQHEAEHEGYPFEVDRDIICRNLDAYPFETQLVINSKLSSWNIIDLLMRSDDLRLISNNRGSACWHLMQEEYAFYFLVDNLIWNEEALKSAQQRFKEKSIAIKQEHTTIRRTQQRLVLTNLTSVAAALVLSSKKNVSLLLTLPLCLWLTNKAITEFRQLSRCEEMLSDELQPLKEKVHQKEAVPILDGLINYFDSKGFLKHFDYRAGFIEQLKISLESEARPEIDLFSSMNIWIRKGGLLFLSLHSEEKEKRLQKAVMNDKERQSKVASINFHFKPLPPELIEDISHWYWRSFFSLNRPIAAASNEEHSASMTA